MTSVTPPGPLGAIGPLTYDGLSRVTSAVDGKGQTTSYTYDPLDRVTMVTHDDGSTIERGYDADGNLTSETDAVGTATMTYDPMGRLAARTTPDGVTVTYGYDKAGNLTSLTDPSGTVVYGYNAVNLATSVALPDAKTITLTYDASYNRTSIAFPDGVTQTYLYDDSNRVTRVSAVKGATTLERFDYSYANPATGNADSGLRFTMTDLAGNTTTYTYDVLNRLTKARTARPDNSLVEQYDYTYDGSGNRTSQSITRPSPAGPLTTIHFYTYNAANQLVDVNSEALTYDGNGNLTGSEFGAELTYDAGDRTTSIRPRADKGLALRFLYLGRGQAERIAAGAVAEHISTNGPVCLPGLGCQSDPNAVVATSTYLHTSLGLSAETTAGVTTSYVRDPAGKLLAQRVGGTTLYLLTDGLGSVVAVNDHTVGTVATYRYDPFGAVTETSGAADITPYRFAGYYLDATGLYKVGERYYDPGLGRWTQQDPVYDPMDPKQWNRYVYVGNDPVNYIDPTGRSWWDRVACVGAETFKSAYSLVTGLRGGISGSAVGAGAGLIWSGSLALKHALGRVVWTVGGWASIAAGTALVGYGLYGAVKTCWDD